jgi:OOP family OmpA-OmpF porin
MMKNTLIILTTIMTFTMSTYAGSKNVAPIEAEVLPVPPVINPIPIYLGIGLVASAVSKDCPCADDERQKDMTYGAIIRAGWDINQYVGVEARYAKARLEKDFSTTTHYGLFLKPQYHITNQMNVYGLLGYGKTVVEGCALKNGELSQSGFSYGLGFEYDFSEDDSLGEYERMFDGQGDQEKGWGLWADYQNLFNNEGHYKVKTNLFSAGVTYDF